MATQSSSFPIVPFSITKPQQNLRLLELPPDLLELLSSDDKPATLQLKSASPGSTQSSTGKPKDGYLHLCTKDKVWSIRQVSTSNSVYITTPSTSSLHPPADPGAMALDDPSRNEVVVTAIAQPTSSLELTPKPVNQTVVEDAIRALIPVYPLPNTDDDVPPPNSQHSMTSLLSNLPYPDGILAPDMRNLFVFEIRPLSTPGQRAAFIPSPHLLLHAWRLFYNTFLTQEDAPEGTDLSTFNVLGLGEITSAIATHEDDGETYASVVNAIMERFVQLEMEEGDEEEELREEYSLDGPLKAEELSVWLGALIVRCSEDAIDEQKLEDDWLTLLPTAWAGYCSVSALGGEYIVQDGKVRFVDSKTTKAAAEDGADGSNATSATAAAGKRKWHEKFAKERNKT